MIGPWNDWHPTRRSLSVSTQSAFFFIVTFSVDDAAVGETKIFIPVYVRGQRVSWSGTVVKSMHGRYLFADDLTNKVAEDDDSGPVV